MRRRVGPVRVSSEGSGHRRHGARADAVPRFRTSGPGQTFDEVQQNYLDQLALKRLVRPDDVAAMVAFLASSEADNITGQAIEVSAGWGLG